MAKKTDTNQESKSKSIDLQSLQDLSFGPDWASSSGKKRSEKQYEKYEGTDKRPQRGSRRPGGGRDRRDRRSAGPREDGQERKFPPFEPTVDVIFVSQDKPFEVLLKAMRTTYKTYELFEIARIILGKENRFIAIISRKDNADDRKLYVSVPDQLPFETREEAINHVVNNHIDKFFDISEVEVEPPSGNFQMVNRCKLTGELLAPPNFHRYQDILKEHYAQKISNLSYERFLEKVESVKDPEVVQQWIDKMKVTRQYTLKQKEEDESPKVVLNALEDVRYYLITERKNEVVAAKDKVRLPGEKIELLPRGTLRRSIEWEWQGQKRFPLVTSNHLRGRLRRCNLSFFKKGSKGITYVCAVKRKPRYKDTVFSESIQALIDYIEAHPRVKAEDLLEQYKPEGVEEITEETRNAVAQDLRWLVGAGYVSEFGNGELLAEKALPINAAEDKNTQASTQEPQKEKKGKKAEATAKPEEKEKDTQPATESEDDSEKPEAEAKQDTPADVEKPEAETSSPSDDSPSETEEETDSATEQSETSEPEEDGKPDTVTNEKPEPEQAETETSSESEEDPQKSK